MIKPVGDVAPWWEGGTFMTTLDELPELERNKTAPLRLPILSKYKVCMARNSAQFLRNDCAIL